jgi:hypothetical protein
MSEEPRAIHIQERAVGKEATMAKPNPFLDCFEVQESNAACDSINKDQALSSSLDSMIAQASDSGTDSQYDASNDIDSKEALKLFRDYHKGNEYLWDRKNVSIAAHNASQIKAQDIPRAKVTLYSVAEKHASKAQEFFDEEFDTQHSLPPTGLLIINIDTTKFVGCVITILSSTTNHIEYGFKVHKGVDELVCTGQSILVPEARTPHRFIDCLIANKFIRETNIQPPQPQDPSDIQKHLQFFNSLSIVMSHEAHLFAREHHNASTMAKFPAQRNELIWYGWALLRRNEGACEDCCFRELRGYVWVWNRGKWSKITWAQLA